MQIADDDAIEFTEVLYDEISSTGDTAFDQNSAWSGNVLYSLLGGDQTGRLVSTGQDDSIADTLDDWRNIQYSIESFNEGTKAAVLEGIWDVISGNAPHILQPGIVYLPAGTQVLVERCFAFGNCSPFLASIMDASGASNAFSVSLGYGNIRTLALIESGYIGLPVTHDGHENIRNAAQDFYGDPGTHNQAIEAIHMSVSGMLQEAISGSNQLEARQALEGLSPFYISGGSAPQPDTGLSNLTNEYLQARAQFLQVRIEYDQLGKDYITSIGVQSGSFNSAIEFVDLYSGLNLNVWSGISPPAVDSRFIFGTDSSDIITGSAYDDQLFGGDGDDTLTANAGFDYLEGGSGVDSYVVSDGMNQIHDSDGLGSITYNGDSLSGGDNVSGNVWESADQRFQFILKQAAGGANLLIRDTMDLSSAVRVNDFSNGDLNISLTGFGMPLPPADTFAPEDTGSGTRDVYQSDSAGADQILSGALYDTIIAFGGGDVVLMGEGNDRATTGPGNDFVHGDQDHDYILAGPDTGSTQDARDDQDVIEGGESQDLLYGGHRDDIIYGQTASSDPDLNTTSSQGDWLRGGEGNDNITGSKEMDFVTAGAGGDIVYTGSGFDVVLGDGDYNFAFQPGPVDTSDLPIAFAADHNWSSGQWISTSADTVFVMNVNQFFWQTGINSNDFTFVSDVSRPGSYYVRVMDDGGPDLIRAGSENDWVAGQTGSDTVYGMDGDDILFGDDVVPLPDPADYGNDYINGGNGADQIWGNAGDDTIVSGPGDDVVYSDDVGDSGSDRVFAGPGHDEVYGRGGTDIIYGGEGDDIELNGGSGNDEIFGQGGDDNLLGDDASGAGDDYLSGGIGDDLVDGMDGNDTLEGGLGDDQLSGGNGGDSLNGGAGSDLLDGGDGNDEYVLSLGDSFGSGLGDTIIDSSGDDIVSFTGQIFANRISAETSSGDLIVRYSPDDNITVQSGASGNVIEEYHFSDGTVLMHSDLFALNRGTSTPTNGNDWLEGTSSGDVIDGGQGDDHIFGLGGDDTLSGSDGDDTIDGVSGDDIINGDNGNDFLVGGKGSDTINGGADNDKLSGSVGDDELYGGSGSDILYGKSGNDTIEGGSGDDMIFGGEGTDVLTGNSGYDTYVFAPEDDVNPTTYIYESESSNAVEFTGGITPSDVTLTFLLHQQTLRITYSLPNYPSSIVEVPYGADGSRITEFVFANQTVRFDDMVSGNFTFGPGSYEMGLSSYAAVGPHEDLNSGGGIYLEASPVALSCVAVSLIAVKLRGLFSS